MLQRLAVAVAALAGLTGSALADPFVFERRELAAGVHLVFRADPSREPVEGNVLVVEQADGLVVFDAGGTPLSGRRIVEQIRAISDKPVSHVVISHWHGDHHLGLPAFREAWPDAVVIAHANTAGYMTGDAMDYLEGMTPDVFTGAAERTAAYLESEAGQALDPDMRRYAEMMVEDFPLVAEAAAEFAPTSADQLITDRLVLADTDAPVEIIHPGVGNTDGDIIMWLPRQQILATGDLVVAPTPYGFGSPPLEWAGTLDVLAGYPFQILVPGHGEPQTDRTYLNNLITLLRWTGGEVERLSAEGLDDEAVAAAIDWMGISVLFAGNNAWLQRTFRDYFATPIVGHALQELRGEPIEQGGE